MAGRSRFGTIITRPGRDGFYVRFHYEGRQVERFVGPKRATARRLLAKVHGRLAERAPLASVLAEVFRDLDCETLTFRKAVELYLEHAKARKRASTVRGDTSRLRILADAPWAGKHLARIAGADLLPWIADRQRQAIARRQRKMRPGESRAAFRDAPDRIEEVTIPGCSGATINRDLALASAVFRWAIRSGHVNHNPIHDVERFSEKGRAREVYLTAEEAARLVDACSPVLRPIVLAALHTGMRKGELRGLRWRAVDPERRELLVEPETEKAGRGRVVPLTPALHALLDALRKARPRAALDGSDAVFCDADGKALSDGTIRLLFDPTVERCDGIPLAKRGRVTFHTLRHTAASLMVAAGVPLFDVAKTLGHSTLAVTMRYAHFAPKAGRAAVDRLGEALAGDGERAQRRNDGTAT